MFFAPCTCCKGWLGKLTAVGLLIEPQWRLIWLLQGELRSTKQELEARGQQVESLKLELAAAAQNVEQLRAEVGQLNFQVRCLQVLAGVLLPRGITIGGAAARRGCWAAECPGAGLGDIATSVWIGAGRAKVPCCKPCLPSWMRFSGVVAGTCL